MAEDEVQFSELQRRRDLDLAIFGT